MRAIWLQCFVLWLIAEARLFKKSMGIKFSTGGGGNQGLDTKPELTKWSCGDVYVEYVTQYFQGSTMYNLKISGQGAMISTFGFGWKTVLRWYNMKCVYIENQANVRTIQNWAFSEGYMKEVDLSAGHSLRFIGEKAFYGCKELHTVRLPSTIFIGKSAFSECTRLTKIEFNEGGEVVCFGANAFSKTKVSHLNIPAANVGFAQEAFNECSLVTVTWTGSGDRNMTSMYTWINALEKDIAYSQWRMSFCYPCPGGRCPEYCYSLPWQIQALTSIQNNVTSLLETVGVVDHRAFANCENLKSIMLGNITKVADNIADKSPLEYIYIANAETIISDAFKPDAGVNDALHTFVYCGDTNPQTGHALIQLPDSLEYVTVVKKPLSAFNKTLRYDCENICAKDIDLDYYQVRRDCSNETVTDPFPDFASVSAVRRLIVSIATFVDLYPM